MSSPYECYVCNRSLGKGDMVVPVLRVEDATYLVRMDGETRYYAHIGCVS